MSRPVDEEMIGRNVAGKFLVEKLPDGMNALRKATSNPNPLLSRGNCFIESAECPIAEPAPA